MVAFHARGHTVDVEAGVKADGTMLGMRVRIVADLGAYFLLSTQAVPALAGHRIPGPYKTPAMTVEVLGVLTNKPSTGVYRGAGGPDSAFCMERTMDLIARATNLDPAEVRRRNFIQPDAFPYRTPTGLVYDSGEYEQGLDRVLELSEYSTWREKAARRSTEEPLLGIGVASVVKASGGAGYMKEESAQVTIEPSGLVTVYTGVSPHGQGTETSFAQIVSNELGVAPADVEVVHSDTALVSFGGGTQASRGTVVGSSALYLTLQEARSKLARLASYSMGCSKEDIVFRDGRVVNGRNPAQALAFSQVAASAFKEELLPPGEGPGLEFTEKFTLPGTPYAFAAHVAVVEVSRETGDVKILQYAAVHDCGRILNPMLVEGQAQGAIAQGVGQALLEGIVYDGDGQLMTGSLMDYALPTANDFGELRLDTIETLSTVTPMGVKGIGELPTVAAPAAIANAVMDALSTSGVRHIDTPLTPEKIWRALQGQ